MIEWTRLCASARDIRVDGSAVIVSLDQARTQRVAIDASDDAIELTSVVARRSVVEQWDDTAIAAWQRNRGASLVGFRIDKAGKLVGESWVPGPGLTTDEFQFYLRSIAAACDLFEYQLTGTDRE